MYVCMCMYSMLFSIGFDWGKQFWGIHSLIQEHMSMGIMGEKPHTLASQQLRD